MLAENLEIRAGRELPHQSTWACSILWIPAVLCLVMRVLVSVPPVSAAPQSQASSVRSITSGDVTGHAISGKDTTLSVTYHGGPLFHTQKIFTIFWNPSSTPFPSDYQPT